MTTLPTRIILFLGKFLDYKHVEYSLWRLWRTSALQNGNFVTENILQGKKCKCLSSETHFYHSIYTPRRQLQDLYFFFFLHSIMVHLCFSREWLHWHNHLEKYEMVIFIHTITVISLPIREKKNTGVFLLSSHSLFLSFHSYYVTSNIFVQKKIFFLPFFLLSLFLSFYSNTHTLAGNAPNSLANMQLKVY